MASQLRHQPRHFPVFDALRGLAILGVLIVHTSQKFPELHPWLRDLALSGEHGVQLFYLVSACTLFWSLHERWRVDTRPFAAFFVRRAFRILPLFWMAIAVYWLTLGSQPRLWAPQGIGLRELITTPLCLHGWTPNTMNAVVSGSWSIAVETTFYCLIPLLFLWLRSLSTTLLAALGVFIATASLNLILLWMGAPAGSNDFLWRYFLVFWFPTQAPIFLLGIGLFFLTRRVLAGESVAPKRIPWLLLAVPASWALLLATGQYIPQVLHPALFALPLMLGAYHVIGTPHLALVNPFMCRLGKISFSVYLAHPLVIRALVSCTTWIPASWPTFLRWVVFLAGVTLVTAALSSITYVAVEVPFQSLGRLLIQRLRWGPNRHLAEQPETFAPEAAVLEKSCP